MVEMVVAVAISTFAATTIIGHCYTYATTVTCLLRMEAMVQNVVLMALTVPTATSTYLPAQ